MTQAYEILDHEYDVVAVSIGGAGLRAVLGIAAEGLRTGCITRVFPKRNHTTAAQRGIAAVLNNLGDGYGWRYHMCDTVKRSDRLGGQDAIEYMCREAIASVIELDQLGILFNGIKGGGDPRGATELGRTLDYRFKVWRALRIEKTPLAKPLYSIFPAGLSSTRPAA